MRRTARVVPGNGRTGKGLPLLVVHDVQEGDPFFKKWTQIFQIHPIVPAPFKKEKRVNIREKKTVKTKRREKR
eukprot:2988375-Ditylum_brightwellii.AAC.1